MSLEEYERKRHFDKTPEPRTGGEVGGARFCVQKHDATRLHYDFRLEQDGVLKSWAVPKGPSLDPRDKRLAMQVEDHPIAYRDFEGVIPEGEYGGGPVLLWDEGTWTLEKGSVDEGKLDFALHGHKLNGRFHLVRIRGKRPTWLLIKSRDEFARDGGDVKSMGEDSVKSGRAIEEVNLVMPWFVEPELCTLVDAPPSGPEWVHEPKIDGYRLIARKEGERVQLFTRSGLDWTSRFPKIAESVKSLAPRALMIDGEVAGPSFHDVQRAGGDVDYYAFDLLFAEGVDLRARPLLERKEALRIALEGSDVNFVEHDDGDGAKFLARMKREGREGMVSKKRASTYVSERTREWLKIRIAIHEELFVVGFTPLKKGRGSVGALLLADESMQFRGKVGTGFSERDRRELRSLLDPLARSSSPVTPRPKVAGIRDVTWVEPKVMVEVEAKEITPDGNLRQPSFLGVRLDKTEHRTEIGTDLLGARQPSRSRASGDEASTKSKSATTSASAAKLKSASAESSPPSPRAPPRAQLNPKSKPASTATKSQPASTESSSASPAAPPRAQSSPHPTSADDVVVGVKITHPDRVLYSNSDITKLAVARYIEAVAPLMLPHVERRPLALVRCPEGISQAIEHAQDPNPHCFFQKHKMLGMPKSIHTMRVREGESINDCLTVDDESGLVGLVQMGALEIHCWGARENDADTPDRIVFDLDPAQDLAWSRVADAARALRQRLADLHLTSWVKSTGGKGLHVVVPLSSAPSWDEVKAWSKAIAESLEQEAPDLYTTNMRKALRAGRVFIDYLRNGRGATAIAPYSMRARPSAPVAVPLSWDEIDVMPRFTIVNLHQRIAGAGDPWEDYFTTRQALPSNTRASRTRSPRTHP